MAHCEAGPTGFGLARHLHQLGVACEVIAPALIPHWPTTEPVKPDRRDARKLAEDSRAGSLTLVYSPRKKKKTRFAIESGDGKLREKIGAGLMINLSRGFLCR